MYTTPVTCSALFLLLCPTPLPRIKQKKGVMKRLDVLQLWGTRQINSDQQLACIQLVPFILFSLVFFFCACSSSIYPDPSLSLSFISQRNNLFLVAFSLLVPGFLHLYSHAYFLYHFLSHLDFTHCYWYSYWGAVGLANFHSQQSQNYSPAIICEFKLQSNSPLSTWEVQALLTVLSVTTFSFSVCYLQCSGLLVSCPGFLMVCLVV